MKFGEMHAVKRMYWALNQSVVKMSSLYSSGIVTLLNETKADYTGITLYNNALYISDASRRFVFLFYASKITFLSDLQL